MNTASIPSYRTKSAGEKKKQTQNEEINKRGSERERERERETQIPMTLEMKRRGNWEEKRVRNHGAA